MGFSTTCKWRGSLGKQLFSRSSWEAQSYLITCIHSLRPNHTPRVMEATNSRTRSRILCKWVLFVVVSRWCLNPGIIVVNGGLESYPSIRGNLFHVTRVQWRIDLRFRNKSSAPGNMARRKGRVCNKICQEKLQFQVCSFVVDHNLPHYRMTTLT